MTEDNITELIKSYRVEKSISDYEDDERFKEIFDKAIFSINNDVGHNIDYTKDLDAKELLFNYVLYSSYNRIAEFKELYAQDYIKLQAKYYSTNI